MARGSKLKMSSRLLKKKARRASFASQKHCRFTSNPELIKDIDYKNTDFLRSFLTERGKILPARISGNANKFQRLIADEVKKARIMGLLPYVASEY